MKGLLLLILLVNSETYCYKIKAYDCLHPTKVKKYDRISFCERHSDLKKDNREYTIIQKSTIQVVDGYSCQVTSTRESYMCGVWAHLKSIPPGTYNSPVEITTTQCRDLVSSLYYKDELGTLHPLKMDTRTQFTIWLAGSVQYNEESGKLICNGEKRRYKGSFFWDLIISETIDVTLRKESFEIHENFVSSPSAGISLSCDAEDGACHSDSTTFLWTVKPQRCPFESIRQIRAYIHEKTYLVDEAQQIMMNLTGNCLFVFFS